MSADNLKNEQKKREQYVLTFLEERYVMILWAIAEGKKQDY